MGIVAGILVQNTLKYLLGFGQVSYYLGYNAMQDFFPSYTMKPNIECENSWCQKRKKEFEERKKENVDVEEKKEEMTEEAPLHPENEFGITLEEDSTYEEQDKNVAPGLYRLYDKEKPKIEKEEPTQEKKEKDDGEAANRISSLREKLKALKNK